MKIASQSGHRLPALTPGQDKALATTPADELLALDGDSMHAAYRSSLATIGAPVRVR